MLNNLTNSQKMNRLPTCSCSWAQAACQLMNSFSGQEDARLREFDSYFEPVRNVIFERSLFNKLIQEESQSLDDFINAVQTQGDKCEYLPQMKDELIRDRIVVGVEDSKLRQ